MVLGMNEVIAAPSEFLAELRDLIDRNLDVEAAHRLSARLGQEDAEALVGAALDMARFSPQPAARIIIGEALARLRPEHGSTWRQVAGIAAGVGDYRSVANALAAAADAHDGTLEDRLGAAQAAYQDNDLDRAEALYRTTGQGEAALCGLAVIALARGERIKAAGLLNDALKANPGSVNALRLLALIQEDAAVLNKLAAVADNAGASSATRAAAGFSLAQTNDRLGKIDAAIRWATFANAIARQGGPGYDAAQHGRAADALLELFDVLEAGAPLLGRPRPLVIVGLPRSGTSLVESILAAHPDVTAGGERTDLALACREIEIVLQTRGVQAARDLFQRRREGLVSELSARLAGAGINTDAYVDKLPLNTPYAGLIARLLPEGRVIFVHRDPIETALSIWLQDFAPAYAYANDLGDIATAAALNERLRMAWASRLGDQFLDLNHDALCADPVAQGRRLFEFCGLEWDESYLDPQNRRSTTNTFSALQVRQAIRPRQPRAPLYQAVLGPLAQTLKQP